MSKYGCPGGQAIVLDINGGAAGYGVVEGNIEVHWAAAGVLYGEARGCIKLVLQHGSQQNLGHANLEAVRKRAILNGKVRRSASVAITGWSELKYQSP